jgi:hypothetical protein
VIEAILARPQPARPEWEVGSAAEIQPIQTFIGGQQIVDSRFDYPEVRGIAESVRLGEQISPAIPL